VAGRAVTLLTARITAAALLLGLPVASGGLAGFPPGLIEMPPETVTVRPPEYAAAVYLLFAVIGVAFLALLVGPERFGFGRGGPSDFSPFEWAYNPAPGRPFPRYGWAGVALIALAWPAAWIRPDWIGAAAGHTFFPLWLGYVVTMDGLVYRRAGASPLTRGPWWLTWFAASAVMWWYFELLNRFIQNWVYIGVEHFSALRYVLGASVAFTTVIPAVLTTAALLGTFTHFRQRFVLPVSPATPTPTILWTTVALGSIGLVLMPWFPIPLFALIWICPTLVVAGLLELSGRPTGFGHFLRGDWGPMVTLGTATVICGFFWEMWNIHALPKWTYQIPWVNRFHLFEMPIVGYLGYLPFGTACYAFWLLMQPRRVDREE